MGKCQQWEAHPLLWSLPHKGTISAKAENSTGTCNGLATLIIKFLTVLEFLQNFAGAPHSDAIGCNNRHVARSVCEFLCSFMSTSVRWGVLCLFFWLGCWVCTLMQRFFEGVIEGHADHPEVTLCGWQDFKIKEQTNCTSVLISSKGLDAQITSPTLQRGGETCWWNQYMNPVPPPSRFKYLNYSATSLLRSSNEKKWKKVGTAFWLMKSVNQHKD